MIAGLILAGKYILGFGFIALYAVAIIKQHNDDCKANIKRPF